MFPNWAVDVDLMKKRLPYYFFKLIEFNQYRVANIIGIQAPGNFKYFDDGILKQFKAKVELLWTWITPGNGSIRCSIDLNKTHLAGRKIFVYAGNMGVAQDFDLIMKLVGLYKSRSDIGFVFVGRGSEVERLKGIAVLNSLVNILFYDEIDSTEIPALYSQCHFGLVALDPRHNSNNVPGKFLSYMNSGLPVLARLNFGNDLVKVISENQIGVSYVGYDPVELKAAADRLIAMYRDDQGISNRCKNLANNLFSTEKAANQIISALKNLK